MKDPRYIIVFGASLTQFTIIGFLIGFGVFFAELERDLGWSRTMLSLGTSIAFLMMGLGAMLGGRLNDQFGPKLVLSISGVIFAAGIVALSQIQQPWQYFAVFGLMIGAGLATHDVVTLSTIARWFDKRRGLMTGLVKTGTAIGQVTVPPIAAFLIAWLGWRYGMFSLGIAAGVILLLAASMMRLPSENDTLERAAGTSAGSTFQEAKRNPTFWKLCAVQFLFFPTLMSVPTHLAVHGQDLGMEAKTAALLLSVMGASSIAGRLSIGLIADRMGGKMAYSTALFGLLASLGALCVVEDHGTLFALIALYGFSHGSLFVVVSPTVSRYFGMRSHGSIFGTVLFFGTIGGAFGPVMTGWVFDQFGSYTPAFAALGLAAGLALLLVQSLPRPAQ